MAERIFSISEKHPSSWIQKNLKGNNFDFKMAIAEDIIRNARELESGINWKEVLENYFCRHGNTKLTGKPAVAYSISLTLASMAAKMGWDMHSPEVVYMSGFHYVMSLGQSTATINTRLQQINQGQITFDPPERGPLVVAENQTTLTRLSTFRKKLQTSIQEYASQTMPQDQKYLEILQSGPYLSRRIKQSHRRLKIYDLLKQGD